MTYMKLINCILYSNVAGKTFYLSIAGKSPSIDNFDNKNSLKFIFYIFIRVQKLIITFFLNFLNYLSFIIINTSV